MPAKLDASHRYRSLPCAPNAITQPDPPSHAPNLRHGQVRPQYHAQNWRESATGKEGERRRNSRCGTASTRTSDIEPACTHSWRVRSYLTLLRRDEISLAVE